MLRRRRHEARRLRDGLSRPSFAGSCREFAFTMIVDDNHKTMSQENPLAREILLAFWKVHILHHAAEGPIYGQWVLEELRRHGYDLSPGTLYPLLKRMESHGWLSSKEKAGIGKAHARREYRLAPAGRKVLKQLRAQVAELHHEVVEEHGHAH